MAIEPDPSKAVSTTAVRLSGTPDDAVSGQSCVLKLAAGSDTVYIGGDNTVTDANGFPWETIDGPLSFELDSGEAVWGVCASGESATVHVLNQGV